MARDNNFSQTIYDGFYFYSATSEINEPSLTEIKTFCSVTVNNEINQWRPPVAPIRTTTGISDSQTLWPQVQPEAVNHTEFLDPTHQEDHKRLWCERHHRSLCFLLRATGQCEAPLSEVRRCNAMKQKVWGGEVTQSVVVWEHMKQCRLTDMRLCEVNWWKWCVVR